MLAVHLEETQVPDGIRLNLNNRQAIRKFDQSFEAYRQRLRDALGDLAPSAAQSAREGQPAQQTSSTRKQLRRAAIGAAFVVLVIGLVFTRFEAPEYSSPGVSSVSTVRVLVTPLSSLDADESIGIAFRDEIVQRLSKIAMLTVLPGDTEDPNNTRLQATNRLSGSIRKVSNETLRVSVQLTRLTGAQLVWADAFDIAQDDPIGAQELVAEKVARALKVFLDPHRDRLLGPTRTEDPKALNAYLKGLIELNNATADSFGEAISYFDQALALNSSFAAAWFGKADAYRQYSNYGRTDRRKAWKEARAFTERGLSLDPNLPKGFMMMADLALYDGNFSVANEYLSRLRSTYPDYPEVGIAYHLAICGQFDDALEAAERMIESDSESVWPKYARIMILWLARRYGEALRYADDILAVTPNEQRALIERSRILASMGRLAEALDAAPAEMDPLKKAFRAGGEPAVLQQRLSFAARTERGETPYPPEYAWRTYVETYAAMEQPEEAVRWGWSGATRSILRVPLVPTDAPSGHAGGPSTSII